MYNDLPDQNKESSMDKNQFWALIDSVNAEVGTSDQETILKCTEKKLLELSSAEIRDWHSILYRYASLAYRQDLWAACTATHSHDTDDGFTDFRMWLISQGKEIYMSVLHDPDSLARFDIPKEGANFESYGYVASYAYGQKCVLEQEGAEALKSKFEKWTARMSVTTQTGDQPEAGEDLSIVRFKSFLTNDHDVYRDSRRNPLSPVCLDEIQSEITLKEDIASSWTFNDLPKIMPRLYAKYNTPEQQFGALSM